MDVWHYIIQFKIQSSAALVLTSIYGQPVNPQTADSPTCPPRTVTHPTDIEELDQKNILHRNQISDEGHITRKFDNSVYQNLSFESQKGVNAVSTMFSWEPEGRYRCYKVYAVSTLLVLKATLMNSIKALYSSRTTILKLLLARGGGANLAPPPPEISASGSPRRICTMVSNVM